MSMTESTTIAKVNATQYIVCHLQMFGELNKEETFDTIRRQAHLLVSPLTRGAVEESLDHPTKRSQLARIAFPTANHFDVALALEAGSTIDALYALARGGKFYVDDVLIPAHLLRDQTGQPSKAKHGLRIVWRAVDVPKQNRKQIVEHYRRKMQAGGDVSARLL